MLDIYSAQMFVAGETDMFALVMLDSLLHLRIKASGLRRQRAKFYLTLDIILPKM